MNTFICTELFTDAHGIARFRERSMHMPHGTESARLSELCPSDGIQFRQSPVGFRSPFHVTTTPQWVFILQGQMEIGLRDGTTRCFAPGQCFFSNDTLPIGASFDERVHGHWSRQVGDQPLVTVFVRAQPPSD